MTATQLWQWSAVDLAEGVRTGAISAQESVQSAVDRMRAVNPAINAVVIDCGSEAIAQARVMDQHSQSDEGGLLRGVPVTVKVNVDTKGHPNSNGVTAMADNIATDDSPVVANLKRAGAIIIGITNTPEFSMRAVTENPLYGRTLNPWDETITPGGSSGGAAASAAMGIGAIAHGNDIGGSLRWPAFANGLSTIRPTQGRIAAYNPSATAERGLISQLMSTQGPIAREVRDVALGLEVMSARDPRDPFWVPAPLDSGEFDRKVAIAQIPDGFAVDPAIQAAVNDAAAMFKDAGWELTEVPAPDLPRALQLWWTLIGTELRLAKDVMLPASSPQMQSMLNSIFEVTGPTDLADYASAAAERTAIIRKWLLLLEKYPVVLSPLTLRTHLSPDGDLGDATHVQTMFRDFIFQAGLNTLGLPCVVTPTGLHHNRPIGVQLIASRFREDVALAAASVIGSRVGPLTHQLWARSG